MGVVAQQVADVGAGLGGPRFLQHAAADHHPWPTGQAGDVGVDLGIGRKIDLPRRQTALADEPDQPVPHRPRRRGRQGGRARSQGVGRPNGGERQGRGHASDPGPPCPGGASDRRVDQRQADGAKAHFQQRLPGQGVDVGEEAERMRPQPVETPGDEQRPGRLQRQQQGDEAAPAGGRRQPGARPLALDGALQSCDQAALQDQPAGQDRHEPAAEPAHVAEVGPGRGQSTVGR